MSREIVSHQKVKCTHLEVILRTSTIEIWWQCKDCDQKFEQVREYSKETSREELAKEFCALTCPNPEDHSRWSPTPCEQVADKVERLLADEREKACLAVCNCCRKGYKLLKTSTLGWEHEVPPKILGSVIFEHCEATRIRQLDLTKLDEAQKTGGS